MGYTYDYKTKLGKWLIEAYHKKTNTSVMVIAKDRDEALMEIGWKLGCMEARYDYRKEEEQ